MDYYFNNGISSNPLIIVDRIMGKGAVILADYIGTKILITPIISEIALEYANSKQLEVYYKRLVPFIINRTGDGRCPIELAVHNVENTNEGFGIIVETLEKLRK